MKNISLTLLFVFAASFASAQSISGITPDTAAQNDTVTLSISGSGTHFTQGSYLITLSNEENFLYGQTQNIQVINDELMQVDFIFSYFDPPGIYNVNVLDTSSNPSVNLSLEKGFVLTSLLGTEMPELSNSTPEYARIKDTIALTVTAKATKFTEYNPNHLLLISTEKNSVIYPDSVQVINDTTLRAEFIFDTGYTLGFYDVVYSGQYLTVPVFLERHSAFELFPEKGTAPEIVEVTPDNGRQGETTTLTIKTSKTDLTVADPDSIVNALTRDQGFYYILPDTTVVIDSVTLEAVYTFTESHELGSYDYSINDPEQSMVLEKRDVFTLSKPTTAGSASQLDLPVKVYPNPASNVLFIETPNTKNATVRLYDFSGRILKTVNTRESQMNEIDLSQYTAGTYLVEIKTDRGSKIEKVIKK